MSFLLKKFDNNLIFELFNKLDILKDKDITEDIIKSFEEKIPFNEEVIKSFNKKDLKEIEGILRLHNDRIKQGDISYESLIKIINQYYTTFVKTRPQILDLWTFKDFKELKRDDSFLVENLIYPNTTTMFYGPPGEFKSIFSVDLALSVAAGHKFLGFNTEKSTVLYCDKENNDQIIKERLLALHKGGKYKTEDIDLFFLRREGDLLDSKFLDKLFITIKEKNIKLVFFDTLHRFADYDENKSDDINRIYMDVFTPLIKDYGCSIVFLHHTNKDGSYRGSGDFLGMVDTCYKVRREKKGGVKTNTFEFSNEKSRSGEIEKIIGDLDFILDDEDKLEEIRIKLKDTEEEQEKEQTKFKDTVSRIQGLIKMGEIKKRQDFLDELEYLGIEYSLSTIKRALKWMVDKEILIKDNKHRYKLPMDENYDINTITEDMTDD